MSHIQAGRARLGELMGALMGEAWRIDVAATAGAASHLREVEISKFDIPETSRAMQACQKEFGPDSEFWQPSVVDYVKQHLRLDARLTPAFGIIVSW